ncbi:hypothetical protein GCM10011588_23950 [Nocardia jinanensis]|uniref:Uncharacterized protein n=1 Tax=Nocardia jinanensis TaxID=382504 RepID=A0A917VQJ4_9NOCA|nr:hypothetical protein GCM10011588_23950 [Nocardia jinanensis]
MARVLSIVPSVFDSAGRDGQAGPPRQLGPDCRADVSLPSRPNNFGACRILTRRRAAGLLIYAASPNIPSIQLIDFLEYAVAGGFPGAATEAAPGGQKAAGLDSP